MWTITSCKITGLPMYWMHVDYISNTCFSSFKSGFIKRKIINMYSVLECAKSCILSYQADQVSPFPDEEVSRD